MGVAKTKVEYEGNTYSLHGWCVVNQVPYDSAMNRWRDGVRDPIELLYGDNEPPKFGKISEVDIDFLKKTRFAREGQENEWQIACDLIAQPYIRIPEIRKLVLG